MTLLDSDHLSVLRFRTSVRATALVTRLAGTPAPPLGTTIANVEESMRGWMASIAKERQVRRQISAYRELGNLFEFFAGFHIALFDDAAADHIDKLSSLRTRVGTGDLKVAAIALANNALLLTANRRDFEQIPGLRFENWLEP